MPRVTATGICERAEFMIFAMRKFCNSAPEHLRVKCFLVPFDFSARVCGEKILSIQWVFSFSRVAGDTATSCTWGFYCGPFCKTVRFSMLVISAAIQKERKDRGSVLSWFRFVTSCRVGSSNGRALPQDADRVHTV